MNKNDIALATLVISNILLISPSTWAADIQNLASFSLFNGNTPYAGLTQASNGLFYGTTQNGGANGRGTIFSFNPNTNALTRLVSFNGASGTSPLAGLTQGSNGLLYGAARNGGANGQGTIFSFNTLNNSLTKLTDFNGTNGDTPSASLTQGSNGLFYGTTRDGGTNNKGTIFSFDSLNNVLTTLISFNGNNGNSPSASLTQASNGLFYGTTRNGGTNSQGTLFSFNPLSNVMTKLVDFNGTNGDTPLASLTQGINGILYGTTQAGGTNNKGTIFSFNTTSNVLRNIASFNGTNGDSPSASLTQASNGLLYGTTQYGGSNNVGTIFSFQPEEESLEAPEPLTILGVVTAIGLGASLKRRIKQTLT